MWSQTVWIHALIPSIISHEKSLKLYVSSLPHPQSDNNHSFYFTGGEDLKNLIMRDKSLLASGIK